MTSETMGFAVRVAMLATGFSFLFFGWKMPYWEMPCKSQHVKYVSTFIAGRAYERAMRRYCIFTAGGAIAFGFFVMHNSLCFPELVPAILIGYPIGSLWARLRTERANRVVNDVDADGEQDRFLRHSTHQVCLLESQEPVAVFPRWIDAIIIAGCEGLGVAFAWGYMVFRA